MGSSIPKKEPRIAQERGTSENGEYNPLAIITIRGIMGKDIRDSILNKLRKSSDEPKAPSVPTVANAADRLVEEQRYGMIAKEVKGIES